MGAVVSALAFPAPPKEISASALLRRDSQNQLVYLTTKSGYQIPAIHIRDRRSNNNNKFTLIYSHGNAEDVGLSLPYLDCLCQVCHCNVLAYEYCGYSLAQGEPSEQNCYESIQAAYDYLTTTTKMSQGSDFRVDPSRIVLFGRSLGTGEYTHQAGKDG
jgi:hypothetical protein